MGHIGSEPGWGGHSQGGATDLEEVSFGLVLVLVWFWFGLVWLSLVGWLDSCMANAQMHKY